MMRATSPHREYVSAARRRALGSSKQTHAAKPFGKLFPKPRQKLNLMVYMFRMLGLLWPDNRRYLRACLLVLCHLTMIQDTGFNVGKLLGLAGDSRHQTTNNIATKLLHLGTLAQCATAYLSIHAVAAREKELITDIEHFSSEGLRSPGYFSYVLVQDVLFFILNVLSAYRTAYRYPLWRRMYEVYLALSTTYVFYHTQFVVVWLVITCIAIADRKVKRIAVQLKERIGDRTQLIWEFRNVVDLCCDNTSTLATIVYSHIVLHVCFRVTTLFMMILPCFHEPPRYQIQPRAVAMFLAYAAHVVLSNVALLSMVSVEAERLHSSCLKTRRLIRRIRLETQTDNEDLNCGISLAGKVLGLRVVGFGVAGYKVSS